MTEKISEESLVAAAQNGQAAASAALVERYAPEVMKFAMKLCQSEEDAREVAQDTLLTALRDVRDFRGTSRFGTWLYSIARSYCIKRRTRGAGRFERKGAAEPELFSAGITPVDERLAGLEISRAIELAISDLEPAQREVLVLRDVEGLSASEVAEALGTSVEAVKSRLHRARRALRDRIAPLLAEEELQQKSGCPDIIELLSQHQEGDVTADVCKQMEAHVANCANCRVRCNSLRRVLSTCSTLRTPELPVELQDAVAEQFRRSLKRNLK